VQATFLGGDADLAPPADLAAAAPTRRIARRRSIRGPDLIAIMAAARRVSGSAPRGPA